MLGMSPNSSGATEYAYCLVATGALAYGDALLSSIAWPELGHNVLHHVGKVVFRLADALSYTCQQKLWRLPRK